MTHHWSHPISSSYLDTRPSLHTSSPSVLDHFFTALQQNHIRDLFVLTDAFPFSSPNKLVCIVGLRSQTFCFSPDTITARSYFFPAQIGFIEYFKSTLFREFPFLPCCDFLEEIFQKSFIVSPCFEVGLCLVVSVIPWAPCSPHRKDFFSQPRGILVQASNRDFQLIPLSFYLIGGHRQLCRVSPRCLLPAM